MAADDRLSMREFAFMRANAGQSPPPLPRSSSSTPTPIVPPSATPMARPRWARVLYCAAAVLALIAALAALAPRDQYTPVDPHSVPALSGDPISGTSCGPNAWPETATLVNTAGPANIYQITCSNGIVTEIAR